MNTLYIYIYVYIYIYIYSIRGGVAWLGRLGNDFVATPQAIYTKCDNKLYIYKILYTHTGKTRSVVETLPIKDKRWELSLHIYIYIYIYIYTYIDNTW